MQKPATFVTGLSIINFGASFYNWLKRSLVYRKSTFRNLKIYLDFPCFLNHDSIRPRYKHKSYGADNEKLL